MALASLVDVEDELDELVADAEGDEGAEDLEEEHDHGQVPLVGGSDQHQHKVDDRQVVHFDHPVLAYITQRT